MQPLPFYKTAAWQRARKQALHDAAWLCARCSASLWLQGRAAHVHHRKPVLVSPGISLEPQNLIALCRSCHDAEHHNMKRKHNVACDVDGMPLDRKHPWNKNR